MNPGNARSGCRSPEQLRHVLGNDVLDQLRLPPEQAASALAGVLDDAELHVRDGRSSVPVTREGVEHDAAPGVPDRSRYGPVAPPGSGCPVT